MRTTNHPILVASLLSLPSVAIAATPQVHTGLWETTVQTEMPGMPVSMPPISYKSCIRDSQPVPENNQPGEHCHMLDSKVDGSEVSWRISCDSENANLQGSGHITYAGDSFSGQMIMHMDQGGRAMEMTQTMQGHRLGDCP